VINESHADLGFVPVSLKPVAMAFLKVAKSA
jgi:hypothetical protein